MMSGFMTLEYARGPGLAGFECARCSFFMRDTLFLEGCDGTELVGEDWRSMRFGS